MLKWYFHLRISGGAEPSVPTTGPREAPLLELFDARARSRSSRRPAELRLRDSSSHPSRIQRRGEAGERSRSDEMDGGGKGTHPPRLDCPGGVGRFWRHSGHEGVVSLPFSLSCSIPFFLPPPSLLLSLLLQGCGMGGGRKLNLVRMM